MRLGLYTHMHTTKPYLELTLGPMFSGKTTHLIQIYNKHKFIGTNVCVINYFADTRYGPDAVVSSHDLAKMPCVMSNTLAESRDQWMPAQVVIINEGQFFPDLFETVIEMVDLLGKEVYVCGLDADFKRQPFGDILRLIPYCDRVQKLNALCAYCKDGTNAIHSHRIVSCDDQVLIGSDVYVPLCRTCFRRQGHVHLDQVERVY